jgi:putative membrane protein
MMGHGFYGGFGGGSIMMLIGFIIIGVLLYLALNKHNTSNGHMVAISPVPYSEALEIAKTRLARGEITVEQFEEIKQNLLKS